jgi:uncharacterized membrane protein
MLHAMRMEGLGQASGTAATRSLLGLSVAVCAALAVYALLTGERHLTFLPWNLFLAWVPYLLSGMVVRIARRTPPRRGALIVPTAIWLLFFPNAPYVVTDLVHLKRSPMVFLPMEALLIIGFAAVALALGVRSLYTMHAVVRARWGRTSGRAFVVGVVMLSGLGVWIGRVLRWNSWDALVDPMGSIAWVLRTLMRPWEHLSVLSFSIAYGMGLLVVYAIHRRMRLDPERSRS